MGTWLLAGVVVASKEEATLFTVLKVNKLCAFGKKKYGRTEQQARTLLQNNKTMDNCSLFFFNKTKQSAKLT